MTEPHVPERFFHRESDYTERFNVGTFKEGQLKIWTEGPVWVTQVKGYGSVELVREICRSGTEVGDRHGKIVTVHDWYEVNNPDRASREILQQYSKAQHQKGQSREIVIAVSTLLLKISISAANIVLDGRLEPILNYEKFRLRFEELCGKYLGT